MADLPITMSAPMVRAILREIEAPGTGKTQTRRILKPQPTGPVQYRQTLTSGVCVGLEHEPRIQPGDRLYVREHWRAWAAFDGSPPREIPFDADIQYLADNPLSPWDSRFRQAMHMPCWASRLTLIVTEVRVERLREISEADAVAEGATLGMIYERETPSHRAGFADLWNSLRGPGAWDQNPWVMAITFRPVAGNIDSIGGEA